MTALRRQLRRANESGLCDVEKTSYADSNAMRNR